METRLAQMMQMLIGAHIVAIPQLITNRFLKIVETNKTCRNMTEFLNSSMHKNFFQFFQSETFGGAQRSGFSVYTVREESRAIRARECRSQKRT